MISTFTSLIQKYEVTLDTVVSGLPNLCALRSCKSISEYANNSPFRALSSTESLLIVGTGPSINNVHLSSLAAQYNRVILVNHALRFINQLDTSRCLFLTADMLRASEIANSDAELLLKLGSNKCLLPVTGPTQLRNVLPYLSLYTPLSLRSYFFQFLGPRWLLLFRPISISCALFPKADPSQRPSLVADYILKWIQSGFKTCYPHIAVSSAFDAIFLALALGFEHIDLIGCDFNLGRADSLSSALDPVPAGAFPLAREYLCSIATSLAGQSIFINNLSYDSRPISFNPSYN